MRDAYERIELGVELISVSAQGGVGEGGAPAGDGAGVGNNRSLAQSTLSAEDRFLALSARS